MCLTSEKYKEESISYCFKDAAFSVNDVQGMFFLGELLAAFIIKTQSFEIGGHEQQWQVHNCPNVLLLPGLTGPSFLTQLREMLSIWQGPLCTPLPPRCTSPPLQAQSSLTNGSSENTSLLSQGNQGNLISLFLSHLKG